MYQGQEILDNTITWRVKNISEGTSTIPSIVVSDGGEGESLPIGTIVPYINNNDLPQGFLVCNGAEILKSEYNDLYNVLGDNYGEASDSAHFCLPDLRGKFLEGNNTAGIEKEAGLPNIKGEVETLWNLSGTIVKPLGPSSTVSGSFETGSSTSARIATNSSGNFTTYGLTFDASKSNSAYSDDVDTVQPPAMTVIYIIKAINTSSSAIKTPSNQITVSYKDTFTYIYPNNGTADNPANVTVNTRYVLSNPFPGYYVNCVAEIQVDGNWGDSRWESGTNAYGTMATQFFGNEEIVVQTGSARVFWERQPRLEARSAHRPEV